MMRFMSDGRTAKADVRPAVSSSARPEKASLTAPPEPMELDRARRAA